MSHPNRTTAAIILIGNELLSGKIRDENAHFLAVRLRALGVALTRIAVVPDVEADIVEEVRRCMPRHTHVFTSGGIGPTHDDITLAAIAAATGRPLVREPSLEAVLRAHFRDRLRPDHLRMADVPEGARLLHGGPIPWPVVSVDNLYILPGVPEILRDKFETIAESFRSFAYHLRNLYLNVDEGEIAALLRDAEATFGVQIGSYPRVDRAAYKVRVTVEADTPERVDEAVDALLAGIAPGRLVSVDPPASGATASLPAFHGQRT